MKPENSDKPASKTLEEVEKEIAGFMKRPGASVTEKTTPMSKLKQPVDVDYYYEVNKRFDFWQVQLAGDDAAYYNGHFPQYMHNQIVMPDGPVAELERAIDPRLENLTFTKKDGASTMPLKDFLVGPARKQAMMMAHKGKVVFEAYPGMNTNDIHLWMSAGKTTVSLIFTQLVAEGKVSMDDMSSKHLPQLQGTLWDEIPTWATATMCVGLDIEETFTSIITPGSWINNFHRTFLGDYKTPYIEQLKKVKKHPSGEKPGGPATMRYSSGTTLVLQYICEAIERKPFGVILQEVVWSKVGFRNPAFLCLAPDGTGVGYGMFSTTPEDMLRYAMLFTPSWNKVAKEPIVTEKMMKIYHDTGKPQAYEGSEEQGMAIDWYGYAPPANGVQWDNVFDDGAMFKHGNNGQGIYVDPKRDFCAMGFGSAANTSGIDYAPGFMRAAAKMLAGH